jgi:hypothetical protein
MSRKKAAGISVVPKKRFAIGTILAQSLDTASRKENPPSRGFLRSTSIFGFRLGICHGNTAGTFHENFLATLKNITLFLGGTEFRGIKPGGGL